MKATNDRNIAVRLSGRNTQQMELKDIETKLLPASK